MGKKGKKRPLEGSEASTKPESDPQEQSPKKLKMKSEPTQANGVVSKKSKKKQKKSLNPQSTEDPKPKIVGDIKIKQKNAIKVEKKVSPTEQAEQKKEKSLAILQKGLEAKEKKKELRKQARQENGQYKPSNVKLTAEQLKTRIEEIRSRGSLSKTARRRLGVFKKKLMIMEGTYTPPKPPTGPTMLKSTKRKIRRHKAAVLHAEKMRELEEKQESLEEKAKAVAQLVKEGKIQKEREVNQQPANKKIKQEVTFTKKNQSQKGKPQKGLKVKKETVEPESDDDDDSDEDEEEDNDSEAQDSENVDSTLNTFGDMKSDDDDDDDDDEDEDEDDGVNDEKADSEEVDDEEDNDDEDSEKDTETPEPPKKVQKNAIKSQKPEPNAEQQKQNPEKKTRYVLFVGNLPYTATSEDIKKHFLTKVTEVASVRIPQDPKTNKPRGFAYVEFKNNVDYEKGLSLHQSDLQGRRINVQYSQAGSKNAGKRPEVIAKNQKLHALRKQGKLAGSVKESNKRSIRRNKQK